MTKWSLLLKAALVGFLTLLLLIPLSMTRSAIQERTSYRDMAVDNITRSYAGPQILSGPVLVARYVDETTTTYRHPTGEMRTSTSNAEGTLYFFPRTLQVNATLKPIPRRLGIFEVPTYEAETDLKSAFDIVLPVVNKKDTVRRYQPMVLTLNLADTRGIAGSPQLQVDRKSIALRQGHGAGGRLGGIHAVLDVPQPGQALRLDTHWKLSLGGTQQFAVVPIAGENSVSLQSSWPHPNLLGDFLPRQRSISAKGFDAQWAMSALATNAQQRYAQVESLQELQQVSVRLGNPVDVYTQADRASKYGFLFVVLTFCGFGLFELLKRLPIHPIQYALVGLALAIFFLLLLSLSEHLPFAVAYLIASAACVGLLWTYLSAVLRSRWHGSLFAGLFTLLYGALYGLLISEDNALVMGTLLLFVLLASVMWMTRKVDWYRLHEGIQPPELPR